MLCTATKAILEVYAKALQDDLVVKYVFDYSSECNITFDACFMDFYDPIFLIFDNDDILVEIDPYYMVITGYLSYQLIEIVDPDRDPSKILYDAAETYWNKVKKTTDFREFTTPEEDFITINILSYLNS